MRALVHLEAAMAQPRDYLQAVGWRLRGLKLRSLHRFSLLLGQSPHAYDLWMVSREPQRLAGFSLSPSQTPPITIVVDCRSGEEGLSQTLGSIAAMAGGSVTAFVLGAAPARQMPGLAAGDTVDLVRWFMTCSGSRNAGRQWVIPTKAGDLLSPVALAAYREALAREPLATLFYADDDLVDADGGRHSPHFKPDWNEELVKHFDFVTGSCLLSCDPARVDHNWPCSTLDPGGTTPVHVPHVLHHRRQRPQPILAAIAAPLTKLPHVSVIVPTRDHAELLRTCIDGLAATDYPSFDITVIDNGSCQPEALDLLEDLRRNGVRLVREDGPFNYAAMHNAVVPSVCGPLICLLNNDIEVIEPGWLRAMAMHALDEAVGAVGARLLYPDRTIQHAGIVIGIGGGAGHAHRFQHDDDPGYFGRAHLPQHVSAVTAACMVLRKDRFVSVGGFDAENFAVAFNDVDLCLKLGARGWRNVYEPRACLIHHESKSRGLDSDGEKKRRFAGELLALKRIWATDRMHDRWHHPELSQFGERFVVHI